MQLDLNVLRNTFSGACLEIDKVKVFSIVLSNLLSLTCKPLIMDSDHMLGD